MSEWDSGSDIEELTETVVRTLEEAPGDDADVLLLSGGLDSSTLAATSEVSQAVTADYKDKGSDSEFAEKVAEELELCWEHEIVGRKDAVSMLSEMVEERKSFDPGLFNDVPVYASMENARQRGVEEVMTGDGGDYLWMGYSFMWDMEQPNDFARDALQHLKFPSEELGERRGLEVTQPYLDPDVMNLAFSIDPQLKVRERPGEGKGDAAADESDERWGKNVLREAVSGMLPEDVVFRPKTDLEYGSGMQAFREDVGGLYSDSDISDVENRYGIELIDGSHMFLFQLFLENYSVPGDGDGDAYCDNCGFEKPIERSHCGTCGIYEEG